MGLSPSVLAVSRLSPCEGRPASPPLMVLPITVQSEDHDRLAGMHAPVGPLGLRSLISILENSEVDYLQEVTLETCCQGFRNAKPIAGF